MNKKVINNVYDFLWSLDYLDLCYASPNIKFKLLITCKCFTNLPATGCMCIHTEMKDLRMMSKTFTTDE